MPYLGLLNAFSVSTHLFLPHVPSGNALYYAWISRHLFYDVIEVCLNSSVFSQRLGRHGIASPFSKPGMWLFAISESEVAQSCPTLRPCEL